MLQPHQPHQPHPYLINPRWTRDHSDLAGAVSNFFFSLTDRETPKLQFTLRLHLSTKYHFGSVTIYFRFTIGKKLEVPARYFANSVVRFCNSAFLTQELQLTSDRRDTLITRLTASLAHDFRENRSPQLAF